MGQPGERRELIFVGTVEAVGPPPTVWSGPAAAYQEVRYRVDEAIRGDAEAGPILVLHAVVRNSPTAEPGDVPSLSSWLFGPGARVVVVAVHDTLGPWYAPSVYFGAMPYSPLLVAQLRETAKPSGPPRAVP